MSLSESKRSSTSAAALATYEVRTRYYQYHAWVRQSRGRQRRDLIRYDNAHAEVLHVHLFDTDGREYSCADAAIDDMPTLDTFIRHAVSLASF